MDVLVIGGTGFLGYHAVRELLGRGHEVTVLALPPLPAGLLLPPGVGVRLADLHALGDRDLSGLLAGRDGVVFAAGADDRVAPPAPAHEHFHRHNVVAAERVFSLARAAGVRKGVLLSSYFAHFDRVRPRLRLSERHPYVRSRREQEARSLAAAEPTLSLAILELPYVFGAMPGRVPLWAPLVRYVRAHRVLAYSGGGTNCVAAPRVAEAIAGALERDDAAGRHLVGDENLSWRSLLQRLARHAVGRSRPVVTLPASLLRVLLARVAARHRAEGRESGLDPVAFVRLQTAFTYFDPAPARRALGYGSGGLEEALADTVAACPPGSGTVWG